MRAFERCLLEGGAPADCHGINQQVIYYHHTGATYGIINGRKTIILSYQPTIWNRVPQLRPYLVVYLVVC